MPIATTLLAVVRQMSPNLEGAREDRGQNAGVQGSALIGRRMLPVSIVCVGSSMQPIEIPGAAEPDMEMDITVAQVPGCLRANHRDFQ